MPVIEEIADEDWLYRRLATNHFRSDGKVNRTAFMHNSLPLGKGKEPDPHVSVDVARLTEPPNSPEASLTVAGKPKQGIGALQAHFPRQHGLAVIHDPIIEPAESRNLAHSLITGNQGVQAMELCELMAEEMSKHVKIYPDGTPWRAAESGGA